MAKRTVSRKKSGDKPSDTKGRGRSAKDFSQEEEASRQESNREIIQKKLIKLTSPILDQYGQIAFEELISRLETVIQEYNEEVQSLFTEMKDQSKDDMGRLKSLMVQEEEPEAEAEADQPDLSGMSEFERRLEAMEGDSKSSAGSDQES